MIDDLRVRKPTLQDVKKIFELQQNDEEIRNNFMSIPSLEKEVKKNIKSIIKIDKLKHKGKYKGPIQNKFVIEINGQVGGMISYNEFDNYNNTKVKISYWIAKPYRSKGYATRALKIVTDYIFQNEKNIVRIRANVRTYNKASARVLEKCGYKLEGVLRKNAIKNGILLSNYVYAKLR